MNDGSALRLESKANYTLVGLIVLILSIGLLTAGLWLSVGFDSKKYNKYIVFMHEPVSGLGEDSLVKYNGVKVGTVESVTLNAANPQEVTLILSIQEGTPITISTYANLIMQGITGTTYLGLEAASPTTTPLQKMAGQLYPVIPYRASFFYRLERNVNELSTSFKRVFSKKNARHLEQALTHLNAVIAVFEQNNANIDRVLKALPKGIEQFNHMSDSLSNAGTQVSKTMKTSRNSVNKITQQALPPTVLLITKLDQIATNLEIVSAQMRQNPSVIIRGTASPKPGPGEH